MRLIGILRAAVAICGVIFWHSAAYSTPGQRVTADSRYASVGLLAFQNLQKCTATVISPTVAITAKHCFAAGEITPSRLSKWSLHFPTEAGYPALTVRDIRAVIFDDAKNDIAFVIFSRRTDERFKNVFATSTSSPVGGQLVSMVGFPSRVELSQPVRVLSQNCNFTGKSDEIRSAHQGTSYDGLLFETTCPGWWAMSGGPVFVETNKKLAISGVITHTFHLTPEGSPDESFIAQDQFGKYVPDVVISPLSLSKRLNEVLRLNPDSIAVAPSQTLAKICGYSDQNSLWREADQALAFLSSQREIDPLFWLPASAANMRDMLLQGVREKNSQLAAVRDKDLNNNSWRKPFFITYEELLSQPLLNSIRTANLATLEFTSSFERCDALGCTDYGTFSIQANETIVTDMARRTRQQSLMHFKRVMGHELGHFIYDFYLQRSGRFSDLQQAKEKIGADAYHLTVDAIGARLAGASASDMASTLKTTMIDDIFGQKALVADGPERIGCFKALPDKK